MFKPLCQVAARAVSLVAPQHTRLDAVVAARKRQYEVVKAKFRNTTELVGAAHDGCAEKVKILLDVQQTVDPKELWFVPSPLGTDVDSSLSLEMERMKRAEQLDELFWFCRCLL